VHKKENDFAMTDSREAEKISGNKKETRRKWHQTVTLKHM
jgi:hypothetical protein